MKPQVRILATCRKPELLPYTLLVFKTLRVGFPTADVHVDINLMPDSEHCQVVKACESVVATWNKAKTIHHQWIEVLTQELREPFFILDTDVIFYENFEQFEFHLGGSVLAGCRIPEWRDDYSASITRARLHTSLLWIDPVMVRGKLDECVAALPKDPFVPFCNPFYPLVVPLRQRRMFYDTCSLLYHTIGGTAFNEKQLDCYTHLNFGTISDLVLPRLPAKEAGQMLMEREAVLNNPGLGRGAWRTQAEYYLSKPV